MMYLEKQTIINRGSVFVFGLTFAFSAQAQSNDKSVVDIIESQMIWIEGGTFMMGQTVVDTNESPNKSATRVEGQTPDDDSPHVDELPAHSVTLDGFYISCYETTQQLWEAVMGSNPSFFPGINQPVESVSWNMVQTFINKLNNTYHTNYRLPTEAEWEFATRGGNKSKGYRYSGSDVVDDVAWFSNDEVEHPQPVGGKTPNELGLYDMSGNIFEWVNDWYGKYSSKPQVNPKGPDKGSDHVLRGGSWKHSSNGMRVSFRTSIPTTRLNKCGFRLAKSASIASAVQSINNPVKVLSIAYYTLDGILANNPSSHHIYVKVIRKEDGSVTRNMVVY